MSSQNGTFDLWRRRSGLVLAPVAFLAAWWLSVDLTPAAHRLAAVLAAVIVLWITEAIPMAMTAFLGVSAAVVLRVAPAPEAFAAFADPLVFLFVGTFLLARAIFFHGLDRRFAIAILAFRGVGDRPGRILAAYAVAACAMSMWISNTATTAMMYPIGLALLGLLHGERSKAAGGYAAVLLLSNAFAASIGGVATPVGTPPNLIGLGFIRRETGVELPFFSWMALGIPVTAVLLAFALANLWLGRGGDTGSLRGSSERLAEERAALGPWTRGQKNTVIAFSFTVVLWVLPGIIALTSGTEHWLYRALLASTPEGVAALLGASLLFLLPVDLRRLEFTLDWEEAVRIDWWIVFLYGGGMALGALSFKTGLAEAVGNGLTASLGVDSALGLLVVSTALATVLSETTSNTASATMVVPVVIAFARSAGIDPILPAVGATMGASLGFMLPVSTPCNAIVYASGRIPLTAMMRHGVLLDVAGVTTIVLVIWFLGPLVVG